MGSSTVFPNVIINTHYGTEDGEILSKKTNIAKKCAVRNVENRSLTEVSLALCW